MKFKRKLTKIGNSYGVTVPISYIHNEMIDPNKEYWFEVTEVSEDAE